MEEAIKAMEDSSDDARAARRLLGFLAWCAASLLLVFGAALGAFLGLAGVAMLAGICPLIYAAAAGGRPARGCSTGGAALKLTAAFGAGALLVCVAAALARFRYGGAGALNVPGRLTSRRVPLNNLNNNDAWLSHLAARPGRRPAAN